MKKLILLLSVFLCTINLVAQDTALSVSVDRETILFGNAFQVKFTLTNVPSRKFKEPVFKDFEIASTSTSSQTSIINGDMTRSSSFTYILIPKEVGNFYIDPVSIEIKDMILETLPIEIIVLDNPDNTKEEIKGNEDANFFYFRNETFPSPPTPPKTKSKKKKRKTYKL